MHPVEFTNERNTLLAAERGTDATGVAIQPNELRLCGRRTLLRPVGSGDTKFLYELNLDPRILHRWRYLNRLPDQETYARQLWDDVLSQFIVESLSSETPIGQVVAYRPRLFHGTAYVGVIIRPDLERQGWPLEAAALFVDYLFKAFPLRKLYSEITDYNYLGTFSTGWGRFFREEARLKEHSYYDGRHWDLVVLSLRRDDWASVSAKFFARIDRRAEQSSPRRTDGS